jgi:isopentenyl-diphosphate delta-isomerase
MIEYKYEDSGFQDLLIMVDKEDNILGYEEKEKCHRGKGMLHRAFSIFIFNSSGRLLLQERSAAKPLWPLFWSNSVCSHPRKGEDYLQAAQRRLKEEIGLETPLHFLFKFQYHAPFKTIGSENELCAVYIGKSDEPVNIDPREIAECRYIALVELKKDLRTRPHVYTPWFKMEWQCIQQNHKKDIETLLKNV